MPFKPLSVAVLCVVLALVGGARGQRALLQAPAAATAATAAAADPTFAADPLQLIAQQFSQFSRRYDAALQQSLQGFDFAGMKRAAAGGGGANAGAAVRTDPATGGGAVAQAVKFKPVLNIEPTLDVIPVTLAPQAAVKVRPIAAGLENALAVQKSVTPAKDIAVEGTAVPPSVATEVEVPAPAVAAAGGGRQLPLLQRVLG